MMRLLIAGGDGQLGKEFPAYHSDETAIICCSRTAMDITDIDSIRRAVGQHQPDALINAAAYTAVDRAEQDSDAAFAINAHGSENLARVAQENSLPFLHVSTDYVFAGDKPRGSLYLETATCAPRTVYGRSKLEGEQRALARCSRTFIVRTSWVFGRYGNNFPKTMLRVGQERDEIRVVADQWGGPTHAADIAAMLVKAAHAMSRTTPCNGILSQDFLPSGIYHYSGAPLCTWFEFATAIFAEAAPYGFRSPRLIPIATHEYPVAAERPANSGLDCSKLTTALAIPLSDWHAGLRLLIATLQKPEH